MSHYPCLPIFQDPVSAANIAAQLTEYDDLADGLVYPSSKRPSNTTCIKEYIAMLSAADNPSPAGRAASFLSYRSSKVQVEFDIISRRLKQRVVEAVVRERHGPEAVRIVRLLLETGKMDEKQVCNLCVSYSWLTLRDRYQK
jgi:DNA-directed RNA polymerase III subunit RPC3